MSPLHDCKLSQYKLYSLVKSDEISSANLSDFVVYMEKFGIPQEASSRHYPWNPGGYCYTTPKTLEEQSPVINARKVLNGLPEVRSGLSREKDSADAWRDWLNKMAKSPWFASLQTEETGKIHEKLSNFTKKNSI